MNIFRIAGAEDMLQKILDFRDDKVVKAMHKSKKPDTNFESFKSKVLANTFEEKKEETTKSIYEYDTNNGKLTAFYSEIYYRNGFVDGIQFLLACMSNDKINSLLNNTNEEIKELFLSCLNEEKS